jgi:hypothetical protein
MITAVVQAIGTVADFEIGLTVNVCAEFFRNRRLHLRQIGAPVYTPERMHC